MKTRLAVGVMAVFVIVAVLMAFAALKSVSQ